MANTNNPPDVVLELTTKQAEFMLRNCSVNIENGLAIMMNLHTAGTLSRETAEKLVELSDQFKEIREILRKQGVVDVS